MTNLPDFHHYLPVSSTTMRWGIYVTGAGRTLKGDKLKYPFKRHPPMYHLPWERGRTLPEFQAILISDGKGIFESEETGIVEIKEACLMFLFPGVWHRYKPDPQIGWSERWISFNGEFSYRLMEHQLIAPQWAVKPPRNEAEITRSFDALLNRIHENPSQNPILLSLRALDLLASAIENAVDIEPPTTSSNAEEFDDPVVNETIDLIWTTAHQPLSVTDVSETLGMNRRTLERRFRDGRGHSILDEINLCRCSRAKRFLRETEMPVKTVVYLSGFSSEDRMRATFRKLEDMTPSEYRDSVR